jgi:integrase
LREVSEARWSEVDLEGRVLVIPPERFKGGVSHRVPLCDDAFALVDGLPRDSEFLFTTTGRKPINGWSRAKDAIDLHMGLDDLPDWKIHDLRHTVRTRMAAMRIPDVVAEMVLGYGRKGIQRVYDQHSYEPEIRDALEQWDALLRAIMHPTPAKVVKLRRA